MFCFPFTFQDGLSLDVKIVPLYHACFHSTLQQGLRLDVRLVFLCYHMSPNHTAAAPLPGEHLNVSFGVKIRKIRAIMDSCIEWIGRNWRYAVSINLSAASARLPVLLGKGSRRKYYLGGEGGGRRKCQKHINAHACNYPAGSPAHKHSCLLTVMCCVT